MAIAVSRARDSVKFMLSQPKRTVKEGVPNQPVWISMPQPALRSVDSLPALVQLFVRRVRDTENVIFSIGPEQGQFQASLNITCRNAQQAIGLLADLETLTETLKKGATEKNANPNDLVGILAGGHFRRDDRLVFGNWFIHRGFLESLAGGAL
jgi:hypothetical protein